MATVYTFLNCPHCGVWFGATWAQPGDYYARDLVHVQGCNCPEGFTKTFAWLQARLRTPDQHPRF